MYVLKDGNTYIGSDEKNKPALVTDESVAQVFKTEAAANNYKKCLPSEMKIFNWKITNTEQRRDAECDFYMELDELEEYEYEETIIETEGFDICDFFEEVIGVMSQIDRFIANMQYTEGRINLKILDVRHYIRDNDHKLSAIQMQRLGYYLQRLEKQRYKCKATRLIAAMFSSDVREMKNKNNIEKMKSFFTNKYKPRILEDEEIEAIINTRKEDAERTMFKVV